MKLNEIINKIRSTLTKGDMSDDSIYHDRLIYNSIKTIRAKLLKESFTKYNLISPFNFQFIDCLPLEFTIIPDCPCVTPGCKLLRTKIKIPKAINSRNNVFLKVYTPAGVEIPFGSLDSLKYNKYSLTKKDKDFYIIHNDHIVIYTSNNSLKNISVKGVFEDPTELLSILQCDSTVICYDPKTQDFPIEMALIPSLNELVYIDIMKYMNPNFNDQENNARQDMPTKTK